MRRSRSICLSLFCFVFVFKYCFSQESCQTPDGIHATCRGIRECTPMLNLLRSLKRPHTPAIKQKLIGYKCSGSYRVCCPTGPILLDQPIFYHNRTVPPDVTNHKNINLLPQECGYLDSSIRITNGENAFMNEFPFMALLQYRTSSGLEFLCGGTIISYNYILTAAHCLNLQGTQLVSVRVGEHSIKNKTDCEVKDQKVQCNPAVQDLNIEEVIPHPQFKVNDNSILNDIALLRVSKITPETNVFPVCLPRAETRDKPFRNVFVTGWGLTNSQTIQKADILQKVGLPIADKNTCAATYSETGIELTSTQICAGGKDGKASCSGDSGGPMLVAVFLNGNIIYVQQGIVSLGPRFCGIQKYPGVYTMVKYYMDWILDNMKP